MVADIKGDSNKTILPSHNQLPFWAVPKKHALINNITTTEEKTESSVRS
jgi:hypothetical protein